MSITATAGVVSGEANVDPTHETIHFVAPAAPGTVTFTHTGSGATFAMPVTATPILLPWPYFRRVTPRVAPVLLPWAYFRRPASSSAARRIVLHTPYFYGRRAGAPAAVRPVVLHTAYFYGHRGAVVAAAPTPYLLPFPYHARHASGPVPVLVVPCLLPWPYCARPAQPVLPVDILAAIELEVQASPTVLAALPGGYWLDEAPATVKLAPYAASAWVRSQKTHMLGDSYWESEMVQFSVFATSGAQALAAGKLLRDEFSPRAGYTPLRFRDGYEMTRLPGNAHLFRTGQKWIDGRPLWHYVLEVEFLVGRTY